MPLYEYHCDQCPNVFEEFRPVENRDYLYVCAVCDGDPNYFMFGVLYRTLTPTHLHGSPNMPNG